MPRPIACLRDLRLLSLSIALDDFGNGFSSLGYLRRFAFDRIKIDRSFAKDMVQPATRAIVRSVVDLAAWLGAGVVAEGVEMRKQAGERAPRGLQRGLRLPAQPPGDRR